jgi:hypothetical protein
MATSNNCEHYRRHAGFDRRPPNLWSSRDSLNGITDAIRTHESIDWIHTRNEEAAAFATGLENSRSVQEAVDLVTPTSSMACSTVIATACRY